MAPPMISAFDLVEQVAEQIELGRNLGAADDGGERALRIVERLVQRLKLGLHGAPGVSRQLVTRGPRSRRGRDAPPKKRR